MKFVVGAYFAAAAAVVRIAFSHYNLKSVGDVGRAADVMPLVFALSLSMVLYFVARS
jgi:hypothetical protein